MPRFQSFSKNAQHLAGHHGDRRLMHAPGGHALVRRFDNDCYTMWLEYVVQTAGNLSGHLFLNLKAPGIDIDKPGELRNSNHPFAWKIPDVGSPDDWRHVMLAMRLEGNVSQHHDLIVTRNFFECPAEVVA